MSRSAVFSEVFKTTAALVDQKGSVCQPAMVIRPLSPLFDRPRFEVRWMERALADLGRPLFVGADLSLHGQIAVGDVVVISSDGSMIIDIDNGMLRCGETGTVTGIEDKQFPCYEVELEGEASRRVDTIKWARLAETPKVGDRVKVRMGAYSCARST